MQKCIYIYVSAKYRSLCIKKHKHKQLDVVLRRDSSALTREGACAMGATTSLAYPS